jgi:S-adenosylmethionine:tRNA ribosyltransferase-isomerase
VQHPSDYAYHLPDELIARHPLADRAASRLLVIDRAAGTLEDRHFQDLPAYLRPGDCLVLNNTKVIPARLFGRRPGKTGKIEILLVRRLAAANRWEALVRPARKLPAGQWIELSEGLQAKVTGVLEGGLREVELLPAGGTSVEAELEAIGHVPLPPYLGRADTPADRERYQTVYAQKPGSAAAPTAGLHFTPELLAQCEAAGVQRAEVTLHVGLGTFQPLSEANLSSGKLHHEYYEISAPAAEQIQQATRRIAVGTTSVRTLESGALRGLPLSAQSGDTELFIRPGFRFQLVDGMITNFHLPESSLLMLVAAFAGYELTMRAYHHAVEEKYRFFSYGDAMLIL